ncbi:MAG: hypothetical protein K2J10_11780, partial [Muribaculaceae bacterium]|nr:hypothetical protein [Muribaculaceae bacterium]
MKKILLTLATVLVGLSAAAATPFSVANRTKLTPGGRPDMRSVEITTPISAERAAVMSRAETSDEVFYTLAGDPRTALGFNSQRAGMQEAMAFQIDPTFLANLTDGVITDISFYTGTDDMTGTNRITKAWVFITDNLQGEFLYTQQVANMPKTEFTEVNVPLDTPFAIPSDSKVYVGVYFTLTAADNIPLVVDYMGHTNDAGGWVAYRTSTNAAWTWDNISSQYGFFTIGATIKGNNMPKNSVSMIGIGGQPVTYANQPFVVTFAMQNNGVNSIENVTVEFGIEGETPITQDFSLQEAWAFNQAVLGNVELTATNPTKSTNVNVTLKAINGEPNISEDKTASYPIAVVAEDKGLPKNAVIEEFTGITCGYCPPGYTSMEKIHEDYPDGGIIPVCVHVNIPNKDPMTATTFNNLISKYCQGAPSAIVNRAYTVDPRDFEELLETAEQVRLLPALGEVTAEAQLDRETAILTVNTKTRFAFDYEDGDKNYILSYAITEDGVGPYSQTNYYTGGQAVWGGWEKKPSSVKLTYNDVARQLD